jgi:pimeloyl-ACP methyl ester carboxylesterase
MGAESGRPLLFCTGAAMNGSLAFGTDHLAMYGYRLIAFDRPGLGASDAHAGTTLLTWADDIEQVIAKHGLRGADAVGFSQGAPFALALAARGLVERVAIVSGQDELAHPRVAPMLRADIARFVGDVGRDAESFEKYFTQLATPEALWQLIIGMSCDRDRALYLDDAFRGAYRRSLWEGFAQGPGGYVRDLINTLSPWPMKVEEIQAPVDLWYGRLDTSPAHSPDFGATLAERLPNASLSVDEAEGGSILWMRARDILKRLRTR